MDILSSITLSYEQFIIKKITKIPLELLRIISEYLENNYVIFIPNINGLYLYNSESKWYRNMEIYSVIMNSNIMPNTILQLISEYCYYCKEESELSYKWSNILKSKQNTFHYMHNFSKKINEISVLILKNICGKKIINEMGKIVVMEIITKFDKITCVLIPCGYSSDCLIIGIFKYSEKNKQTLFILCGINLGTYKYDDLLFINEMLENSKNIFIDSDIIYFLPIEMSEQIINNDIFYYN